jgi:GAF domain-containing protein
MSTIPRESWLGAVYVSLADAVPSATGTDVGLREIALAAQSIDGVAEAGILLVDATGSLEVMASSSTRAEILEVLQLAHGEGPSVECFRTGELVRVDDLAVAGENWSALQRSAKVFGIRSMLAVPLRLRGDTIGTMSLFSEQVGAISERDVALARALADVATIGILQSRTAGRNERIQIQLQSALESRVLIEQAKGLISGSHEITIDAAFALLRDHARSNNMRLQETARLVVDRSLSL